MDSTLTFSYNSVDQFCNRGLQVVRLLNCRLSGVSCLVHQGRTSIQSTIRVVRKLGRKYLWVDKYCINQNDEADKQMMLRNIDLIYENAEVTISQCPVKMMVLDFQEFPDYREHCSPISKHHVGVLSLFIRPFQIYFKCQNRPHEARLTRKQDFPGDACF